jgi:Protein of unknown function (DUF3263)
MPRARSDGNAGQLTLVFDPGPDDLRRDDPASDDSSAAERSPEAERPIGGERRSGDTPDPVGDWRALLDFERGWFGPLALKQRAIRDSLGLSSARYHQLLDRALELPDALAYDPALVGRLRRVREARRSKRFVRRVDASG